MRDVYGTRKSKATRQLTIRSTELAADNGQKQRSSWFSVGRRWELEQSGPATYSTTEANLQSVGELERTFRWGRPTTYRRTSADLLVQDAKTAIRLGRQAFYDTATYSRTWVSIPSGDAEPVNYSWAWVSILSGVAEPANYSWTWVSMPSGDVGRATYSETRVTGHSGGAVPAIYSGTRLGRPVIV